MRAEQLTPPWAGHGEGPVWVAGTLWPDGLHWVDMLVGDVLSLDPSGQVQRRHVSDVVAVVRPRTSGGLVYAVERGFAVDDGPSSVLRRLPELWHAVDVRMNEGGCDPDGNLYCGSMTNDARPGAGAFYRLGANGHVAVVERDWTIPNGLEWSPDGTRAYHANTEAGRVETLDWDSERGLHSRRPFVHVQGGDPDGLTIDAEGGVWVALWGGAAVHRYAPDGSLSEVIEVPVTQVSACTFGGEVLSEIYITTSREGLADPEEAAGAVFTARPGVLGLPVRPYRG